MEKKKVLHIVEAFGGGIFSFLVDLVNNTSDEFDITIAYALRDQTPDNFKDYFNKNVNFVCINNFTRSVSFTKDIKAFLEIKKLLKLINPDIVHLHSSKAGIIGRFACNCKKMKVLYNPHGFSFLMQNCSKLKRYFYWGIEKIATINRATIVGCSKGEYEEALKLSKRAICISNGINIHKVDDEIKDLKHTDIDFNNLKICTSGRIGFQKNPEMFNKIAESFPNLKFTWVGEGDLRDQLSSSNITITGWKTREEVLKYVNESDVFILTSLWEGLPISLLEAMYLGKVCVVTNCIGNRDVINHNENGFIIDENNFKEVIENITEENYARVSKAAKDSILNIYNTDRMTDEYRKEYNK